MKMVNLISRAALCALVLFFSNLAAAEKWHMLLDKNLTQWNTYLGFPNPETDIAGLPKDADGKYTRPIGYNKDEKGVFTVDVIDGEPVLHISGEIYGGIYTKKSFKNYHLSLQYKWGTKKWNPRKDLELDTGVLYHVNGEHGVDYWKAWALSQELQIAEQSTGDWWQIVNSQIDIRCEKPAGADTYIYNPQAKPLSFGAGGVANTCRRSENNEKPNDQWNTVELITYGDKSLHIVNGKVVMALSNSRYMKDGKAVPLDHGQILLQSEAGEVFYKNIKLEPIDGIPAKYRTYFD